MKTVQIWPGYESMKIDRCFNMVGVF